MYMELLGNFETCCFDGNSRYNMLYATMLENSPNRFWYQKGQNPMTQGKRLVKTTSLSQLLHLTRERIPSSSPKHFHKQRYKRRTTRSYATSHNKNAARSESASQKSSIPEPNNHIAEQFCIQPPASLTHILTLPPAKAWVAWSSSVKIWGCKLDELFMGGIFGCVWQVVGAFEFVVSQGNYGWKCDEANQRVEMIVGRFWRTWFLEDLELNWHCY